MFARPKKLCLLSLVNSIDQTTREKERAREVDCKVVRTTLKRTSHPPEKRINSAPSESMRSKDERSDE